MALFPCPDYTGAGPLTRFIGFAFPKTSPEYKNYVRFAYRRPERWTSMIYDATALAASAATQRRRRRSSHPAPRPPRAPAPPPASPAPRPRPPRGPAEVPTREAVRLALAGIDGYRGIRGAVKLGPDREPVEPKAMVYFALNRVGKKEDDLEGDGFAAIGPRPSRACDGRQEEARMMVRRAKSAFWWLPGVCSLAVRVRLSRGRCPEKPDGLSVDSGLAQLCPASAGSGRGWTPAALPRGRLP